MDANQGDDPTNAHLLHQEFHSVTNPGVFTGISRDISRAFPDYNGNLEKMLVFTWKNIPPRGNSLSDHLRNTFQAVLAADSKNTFLVLYYSRVEWTNGLLSEVGIFAGTANSQTMFTVGDSCSEQILSVPAMSNFGVPGKFVFKVDMNIEQPVIQCIPKYASLRTVDFKPRIVSPVGVTQLLVTGLQICVDSKVQRITCSFQEESGPHLDILLGSIIPGNSAVVCSTPKQFNSLGKVRVTVRLEIPGFPLIEKEGFIIVDTQKPSLVPYRESPGYFTAIWNKSVQNQPLNQFYTNVLFGKLATPPKTVNISLLQLVASEWTELYTERNVLNTGQASIQLPYNVTSVLTSMANEILPTCYKVSMETTWSDGSSYLTEYTHDIDATIVGFGRWKSADVVVTVCANWYHLYHQIGFDHLSCPPTMEQAIHDWRYTQKDTTSQSFVQLPPTANGASVKCVYDRLGHLLKNTKYGSHLIWTSKSKPQNLWRYYQEEFTSELSCCILEPLGSNTCSGKFLRKRSISTDYDFPTPFKVTGVTFISSVTGGEFRLNAVGAFWLLKSVQTSWQILTEPYSSIVPSPAAVIKSLVLAGHEHSRFQVVAVVEGLQIWVNEQPLNFYRTNFQNEYEYMTENFTVYENYVTAAISGTKSVLFSFSSGLSVKITPSQNCSSLNIIGSVSWSYEQKVTGLLKIATKNAEKSPEVVMKLVEDWRVSHYEFMFWFPQPRDHINHAGSLVTHPVTERETLMSLSTMNSICGNSVECRADFELTHNIKFAKASLTICLEYAKMMQLWKTDRSMMEGMGDGNNSGSSSVYYWLISIVFVLIILILLYLIRFMYNKLRNTVTNSSNAPGTGMGDLYLEPIPAKSDNLCENHYETLDHFK